MGYQNNMSDTANDKANDKASDIVNNKASQIVNHQWLSQARMVINLPNLRKYEDTLAVVGSLSTLLGLCYVITGKGQELKPQDKERWPKIILIHCPQKSFPKHASKALKSLVKANGVEIIHDFFGHFSTFCELDHPPSRPYIMLHTQRTTNWGWFSRVRPLAYQIDLTYAGQRTKSLWNDTRILHAVDHITVMGPGHELDLIEGHGIPSNKISFIPSETDCERFNFDHSNKKNNPYTIKEAQSITLLYTGALVRAKGLELLFSLFERLYHNDPRLELIMIGRETDYERRWFRQKLESYSLKDKIRVIDFLPRDELIRYYQSAHLYLFPSLFEGSPRSLREALACGTPAVASDIPGNKGIDPKEQFIHFAPVNDLDAWYQVVQKALYEPSEQYEQRAKQGREWLIEHHQPMNIAQRWAQLYLQVAQQVFGKGI